MEEEKIVTKKFIMENCEIVPLDKNGKKLTDKEKEKCPVYLGLRSLYDLQKKQSQLSALYTQSEEQETYEESYGNSTITEDFSEIKKMETEETIFPKITVFTTTPTEIYMCGSEVTQPVKKPILIKEITKKEKEIRDATEEKNKIIGRINNKVEMSMKGKEMSGNADKTKQLREQYKKEYNEKIKCESKSSFATRFARRHKLKKGTVERWPT